MSFAIFTDSTANLPSSQAAQCGVSVIPLSYTMDGVTRECTDTAAFDAQSYYEAMKAGAQITTSQINPQKYIDRMEPVLKDGTDILFLGISAGISGSFTSAQIAREQLLELYPERSIELVDTLGASLGEGIHVLHACRCRDEGMTLAQTAQLLLKERQKMYQIFTVDDLMHLRKGGRLSNASAIVGTLLNIKPLLKGNEIGKIVSFGKVRGRKAVLAEIARRYDALVVNAEEQIVGISYCGCKADAEQLASYLKENHPPKEIMLVEHEPVTGSYLGMGGLALYFMGDEDVRLK